MELCQEETVEVPGEAEDQPWEDEELQEDEMELGEAVGEDGEPPPEEADSVWGCCNRVFFGCSSGFKIEHSVMVAGSVMQMTLAFWHFIWHEASKLEEELPWEQTSFAPLSRRGCGISY